MKYLLIFLLTVSVHAIEFREVDLTRVEERYDDSLDVLHNLYRCGEVVTVNGRLCIVWDYRFDGREWRYEVRKARYIK